MNFSLPIPRVNQPKFHEGSGFRSPRDSDALALGWKKQVRTTGQGVAQSNAMFKLQQDLNRLRRRQLGYTLNQDIAPFTIYNINNITNSKNSWRTFQIRSGWLGAKSCFAIAGASPTMPATIANFEIPMFVTSDIGTGNGDNAYDNLADIGEPFAPLIPNKGGDKLLSNTTDTVLATAGDIFSYQIVLQPDYDSNGNIWASFWIDVEDTGELLSFIHPVLYGRMYGAGLGRPTDAFPIDGPNIIPIGTIQINSYPVWNGGTTGTHINQIHTGNLLNRFAGNYPSAKIGSPIYWRGRWSADDLSGQAFYDGDGVLDDVNGYTKSGVGFNKVWIYKGGAGIETDPPASNGSRWEYVCAYL